MIRTTVTPQNTTVELSVSIPKEYVGKQLEVLLFASDEVKTETHTPATKKKPSDFVGTLSKEAAKILLDGVAESKREWERNI